MEGVGTNRYAYAQNDPVNKSDPNGHADGGETQHDPWSGTELSKGDSASEDSRVEGLSYGMAANEYTRIYEDDLPPGEEFDFLGYISGTGMGIYNAGASMISGATLGRVDKMDSHMWNGSAVKVFNR